MARFSFLKYCLIRNAAGCGALEYRNTIYVTVLMLGFKCTGVGRADFELDSIVEGSIIIKLYTRNISLKMLSTFESPCMNLHEIKSCLLYNLCFKSFWLEYRGSVLFEFKALWAVAKFIRTLCLMG